MLKSILQTRWVDKDPQSFKIKSDDNIFVEDRHIPGKKKIGSVDI